MQKLVAQAIAAGTDAAVDPDALPGQVQLYRSAAQIGLTQTAARCSPVMRTVKPGTSTRTLRSKPRSPFMVAVMSISPRGFPAPNGLWKSVW
jgi:hypothetical protein